MRKVAVFLSMIVFVVLVAGCSESPREAGLSMAKKHIADKNPSPTEKARMQREIEKKTAKFSMAEKQEFMMGYLEAVTFEMQKQLTQKMGQVLPQTAGSFPRGRR